MKRFGVGGLLALGLLLVPGAALGASPTTCTGTVSGTYQALVVPSGATCILNGATVLGDVTVLSGGTLDSTIKTSTIQGSLVNRGGDILGFCGNINGSVSSVGGRFFLLDTLGRIGNVSDRNVCSQGYTTVGGSISVSGLSQAFNLTMVRTSSSVKVTNNTLGLINVAANTIGGALSVTDNTARELFVDRNQVSGSTTVSRNKVGSESSFFITDNRISGSLSCNGNTPPPTLSGMFGGNEVSGATTGQCKV